MERVEALNYTIQGDQQVVEQHKEELFRLQEQVITQGLLGDE